MILSLTSYSISIFFTFSCFVFFFFNDTATTEIYTLSLHDALPIFFNRFMMLMERDYKKSRDVNYYAEQMNITSKYLSNIVRQVTGHTPKIIIDQYVVLQLKMQLKRSAQSIKEMAWEYHFADASFFCRYFKKHTGMTPQQVRE